MDFGVLLDFMGWSGLDARQEISSTLLQTLIVAPLVSLVVTRWQRAHERGQRVRMIPHLVWSTYPVRADMDALTTGPEGDMVRGGLAMFARQFDQRTDKMYDGQALGFYLGQPQFLIGRLRARITQQVDYVDGLLDLFAPHFRTSDAIQAQRLRSALRAVEQEVDGVQEAVSVLGGSVSSTVRLLEQIRDTEAAADPQDEEGARTRRTLLSQASESMVRQADELVERFDALPSVLDPIADAAIALVEGFYDDTIPYARIVERIRAKRWYKEEEARRGAAPVSGTDHRPESEGVPGPA